MTKAIFASAIALNALTSLAVPKANPGSLNQVFDIDFANDKAGGCKGHEASIEKTYTEAVDIISKAFNALEWLSNLKQPPTESESGAYAKLTKINQAYKLLVGNENAFTAEGVNPSVKVIQETFGEYLESHQVDEYSKIQKQPKFHLRCGDHWLQYLGPDDKDPREGGRSNAENYTIAKPRPGLEAFPHGAMFAHGMPQELNLVYLEQKPKDTESPWCSKRAKAVSTKSNKLLILCPLTYMRPPSFRSRNKHDFPDQLNGVEEGDSLDIIDTVPAVTLVHEMGHYVKGWTEPKALSPRNHQMELVYDLDMAVSLSKSHNRGPMPWPENLALFAAAVELDQWYWGSGKASSDAAGSNAIRHRDTDSPKVGKTALAAPVLI